MQTVQGSVVTALVPLVRSEHFAHVTQEYRGKVARDLVGLLTQEHRWDYEKFNPLNDYQRHLYALFLRLAGIPGRDVWKQLWAISVDVSESQRYRYIEDVMCSSIVGFTSPTMPTREPLGTVP